MGLFSRSKDNETSKTSDNYEDKFEDVKMAEVEYEVTESKQYTEHVAKVKYVDGTEEEIVFDEMTRHEHCIVLENYIGVTEHTDYGCGHHSEIRTYHGLDAEKFMTLSLHGLKSFETIERREESMEYTVTETETKRAEDVEGDERVVDTFIREVRK